MIRALIGLAGAVSIVTAIIAPSFGMNETLAGAMLGAGVLMFISA